MLYECVAIAIYSKSSPLTPLDSSSRFLPQCTMMNTPSKSYSYPWLKKDNFSVDTQYLTAIPAAHFSDFHNSAKRRVG